METNDKKLKFFNFRPMCVIFAVIMFSLIAVNYLFLNKIILGIIFFLLILAVLIITIIKKKYKFAIVLFVFILLFSNYFLLTATTFQNTDYDLQTCHVVARIESINYIGVTTQTITLSKININNSSRNYKIKAIVYDEYAIFENVVVGNIIAFTGELTSISLYGETELPNADLYIKNLKYSTFINTQNISVIDKDLNVIDKVKIKLQNILDSVLNIENSSLAYASLFGDMSDFSYSNKIAFNESGILHLIAVSGLHTVIIGTIIYFILSLFKLPKLVRYILTVSLLFFYSYLCNFCPSVVRSSIMTAVLLLAPILKKRYDGLSATCFAAILISVVNPFAMFGVGAMMSFGCVFCISMFYRSFNTFFNKIRFPKWLSSSLAMTLSAQLGITPSMFLLFGKLSVLSFFTNIICVPLFTFAFSVTFVVAILSLILPFLKYILYLINPVYSIVINMSKFVSSISFATIDTNIFDYFSCFLYTIIVICASRICLLDRHIKYLIIMPVLMLMIAYSTMVNIGVF